jgi:hypothetical protein
MIHLTRVVYRRITKYQRDLYLKNAQFDGHEQEVGLYAVVLKQHVLPQKPATCGFTVLGHNQLGASIRIQPWLSRDLSFEQQFGAFIDLVEFLKSYILLSPVIYIILRTCGNQGTKINYHLTSILIHCSTPMYNKF